MTSKSASADRNVDPGELAKFAAIAHRWWDPDSEFKPLHDINPLRVDWIDRACGGLRDKRVLDVGCGGGILAEAMARRGASVTGIDLGEQPLAVAKLHGLESGVRVDYRLVSAEALAVQSPAGFDVVTCLEMLEHVPEPGSTIAACATLVRPGGVVAFSTINRNPRSWLQAIVGAEYVLGLLPRGTHDWSRFVTPSELARHARHNGLDLVDLSGMTYNPWSRTYRVAADTSVNYLAAFRRGGATS